MTPNFRVLCNEILHEIATRIAPTRIRVASHERSLSRRLIAAPPGGKKNNRGQ
jgi:hypothetical protein